MSKFRVMAIALFILTAILHIILSFYYGISSMYGYLIFGFIYLLLGVSMLLIKRKWFVWLCLIIPSIGLITSIYENIKYSKMIPIYPFLALIDIAIVIFCIVELKRNNSNK